jgi:hypothetical protein
VTPSFPAAAARVIMVENRKLWNFVDDEDYAAALMRAAHRGDAPEELIRAMVKRAPINYINCKSDMRA